MTNPKIGWQIPIKFPSLYEDKREPIFWEVREAGSECLVDDNTSTN